MRSFGLALAIGFLLMVSLAVTAALAALNGWLARYAPSIPLLWSGVSMCVSLVVTTGLFALLFRFLPDVHLRWRDVMTGSLATAVLFTPLAIGIAHQLGVAPMPFVVAVILGASCAFATPVGYQTNMLVMGPGHYRFRDYLIGGGPPAR